MGSKRSRKSVSDVYKRNLQTWAIQEKARLGGISERDWADKIFEKTGVKISYTPVHTWLNADTDLTEEMSDNSLLALSRWREDKSPEYTRRWLWGGEIADSNEQLGSVMAWMKTASPDDVATAVREGVSVLAKQIGEKQNLPEIALNMKKQGISLLTLLNKSTLTEDEQEDAIAYLTGQSQKIDTVILDDLNFTLSRLTERRTPRISSDNLQSAS